MVKHRLDINFLKFTSFKTVYDSWRCIYHSNSTEFLPKKKKKQCNLNENKFRQLMLDDFTKTFNTLSSLYFEDWSKRDFDTYKSVVLYHRNKLLFIWNGTCQVTKETNVKRNSTNKFSVNAIIKVLFSPF